MDFAARFADQLTRVEQAIDRLLPPATAVPPRLHEAMRYAMQAGGKRLRPVLVLAAAELTDPDGRTDPLPAAVAVECVHTYSLVHDDLPCMDDDELRRGRPTCHKAFDEATALLAGDALLTHAFALLADSYRRSPRLAAALCGRLAEAAGADWLIGGQMLDLLGEKSSDVTETTLRRIHDRKTAAMIWTPLVMGALIGGARAADIKKLRSAGQHLGMAFQIVDDVLDAIGDAATLGKTPGKDARSGKATFVGLHGLARSRQIVEEESAAAVSAFRSLPGNTDFLVALTRAFANRSN
jgi:geranylgeranyl pyrophosphate synthase